ncbi:MAG: hypothetical protein HFG45_09330 [Oscillospiraceae bacterium]|jgi:hypothetical protein|nr:hypothetical protein [Oscillospiraceae bacterium]
MKAVDYFAKTIRVITVPALTSGCAMTLLWLSDTVIYRGLLDYVMVMLGLTVVPLLSYGFTAAVPKLRTQGRETQRKYAMYFSAAGYLLAFAYGLASRATGPYKVITGTYVISIVLLLVLNKAMHFKASGHACSTAGPLVAMGYFLGGWYIPAGLGVCALVMWASIEQKQHRFWELMTGSAVSGLSFLCLVFLI